MQWLRQLSKAIDYIEGHLAGSMSYDEAARIACCSTYYFHRVFTYVTGISVSEYVRRRRMTAAAFDLQTGNEKVMDIALKYGYTSPTSFNRAFQNVHGVTPTAARREGTPLNAFSRISFSISVSGDDPMRYRIEKKDAFNIAGIRTSLSEDIEKNFLIAPAFWEKTIQSPDFVELSSLAGSEPSGILGVSVYKNPTEIYYYIAAATNRQVPQQFFSLEIPAATWAIFDCNGPFSNSIQQIFRRFYTEWLPFSGYEYAGLPDIEVYPVSNNNTGCGSAQVWIAVRSQKD